MLVSHELFVQGYDDPTDITGDELLELLSTDVDDIRPLLRLRAETELNRAPVLARQCGVHRATLLQELEVLRGKIREGRQSTSKAKPDQIDLLIELRKSPSGPRRPGALKGQMSGEFLESDPTAPGSGSFSDFPRGDDETE